MHRGAPTDEPTRAVTEIEIPKADFENAKAGSVRLVEEGTRGNGKKTRGLDVAPPELTTFKVNLKWICSVVAIAFVCVSAAITGYDGLIDAINQAAENKWDFEDEYFLGQIQRERDETHPALSYEEIEALSHRNDK